METGDLTAEVTVTVANTGPVVGAEVVQVYVRDVEASVGRPVRELKGFAKVTLDPGASGQVTITLDQRAFSFWSELLGRWVVEAGEFGDRGRAALPRSPAGPARSRSTHPRSPRRSPPTPRSTSGWPTPAGLALIKEAVATGQPDPTKDAERSR